ncbi:OmpA family protein [Rhodobacter ferrooxidans]|uniref:OmpA/MotB domain protein n=1 Tax=Rhodobacter ferrooxidans TaxID=371731 RepID=C8S205_9RHOB|nr:phosphate ABC transporter substrate-binding/OmpA family protein [Rhodobacter sp. SW2]EEW24978.1 OmpA/MotB domain protein [Rhodobacter sp. SW2]
MGRRIWGAAVIAAFLHCGVAAAQDVTLTARDGGITLDGTLQGFDGEFYRIETAYGLLTVDGEGVICTGPGCPDLTAPLAVIRIQGAADAGNRLLPGLLAVFAATRGLQIDSQPAEAGFAAELTDAATGQLLARISFAATAPAAAEKALASGAAELVVSATAPQGMGSRVLGLDALIAIVAQDNAFPRIATPDLARVLLGEVTNWQALGGPDMPLVLHALEPGDSLQAALEARLGRPVAASVRHPDLASLAAAVARDPWALAITGRSAQGAARALPLTDSCSFPLLPTGLAVKAEDYPLSLPLYLLTPRRRLPLLAREFLEFLALPEAQASVAAAGYVDRAPERQPMTADGLRLINAIRGAGADVTLDDLKRLADLMVGADRLSLTFRFEDGSTTLDAHSRDNLADLARLLAVGEFRGQDMVLAGFSDGAGDAAANLALSQARAEGVLAALTKATPDLPEGQALPRIEAFGEALPMACDTTAAGRRLNRRVEVWLRPLLGPVKDSLVP